MVITNSFLKDIPLPIRLFLGKALLFFLVWKIVYMFFLIETKIIDYPLTTHVADASVYVLNSMGFMSDFTSERVIYVNGGNETESSEIVHNGNVVLYVADACNGLELFMLYIGFIVCMPSKFWRKVKYIIIGVIIIDIMNILRCCGLIYLREYFHQYFEFAHHYLFKIMVYAVTFVLWIVFSRKLTLKHESV
ncbi:hypothetical protein MHTCC0001_25280 [Flavobacteriaceae bacterium MHTCC 0001]